MAFNSVLYQPGTIAHLLTTELNSLANGSGSALGTEYDNSTNLFLFGDFILNLAIMVSPTANLSTDLYLVPATDGTNYNQGGTTARPPNFFRGSWVHLALTTTLLTISGVPLPPCKFKIFVHNQSGQAYAASANTVDMLPYGYKVGT